MKAKKDRQCSLNIFGVGKFKTYLILFSQNANFYLQNLSQFFCGNDFRNYLNEKMDVNMHCGFV